MRDKINIFTLDVFKKHSLLINTSNSGNSFERVLNTVRFVDQLLLLFAQNGDMAHLSSWFCFFLAVDMNKDVVH